MKNIALFPACIEIKLLSLLLLHCLPSSVDVKWLLECWEFMLIMSSQERLFLFFSPFLLFFFPRVSSSEKNNLSNHFYSTLEEQERGMGREKPFCDLIAYSVCVRLSLSLSKLTQLRPRAHCLVLPRQSGWPPLMDQIMPQLSDGFSA